MVVVSFCEKSSDSKIKMIVDKLANKPEKLAYARNSRDVAIAEAARVVRHPTPCSPTPTTPQSPALAKHCLWWVNSKLFLLTQVLIAIMAWCYVRTTDWMSEIRHLKPLVNSLSYLAVLYVSRMLILSPLCLFSNKTHKIENSHNTIESYL